MVSAAETAEQVEAPEVAKPALRSNVVLRLPERFQLTDDCILEIAGLNDNMTFERTADGELVIVAPPAPLGIQAAVRIIGALFNWAAKHGGGAFDGTCGYSLPDGALMEPDASWIDDDQYASHEDWTKVFEFAPRFAVEVRSPSQTLAYQRRKIQQWMDNGVRLGWLVDPIQQTVWVYRPRGEPERLERPDSLGGEDVMPGFEVELADLWQ